MMYWAMRFSNSPRGQVVAALYPRWCCVGCRGCSSERHDHRQENGSAN